MDRLHVVKLPFTAATLWVGAKSRNFKPGEILWFDDEDRSGIFRADGFNWFAEDVIEFIQSIEPSSGVDTLKQRAASRPDAASSLPLPDRSRLAGTPKKFGKIQRSSRHNPRFDQWETRMMKDERAVKAKQGIWKVSWVVIGLLVVILSGVLMAFMTCRRTHLRDQVTACFAESGVMKTPANRKKQGIGPLPSVVKVQTSSESGILREIIFHPSTKSNEFENQLK